jgi:predicted nucleic acid-binding Zn ribbon protein
MEEKRCLNCGEPVGSGRKDKKYCSEACKTDYNNNHKGEGNAPEMSLAKYMKRVQQILVRNREILNQCLGDKESISMDKQDLDGRGFTFKYFTSRTRTKKTGEIYCFNFELGYKEMDDDRVIIVRREREIVT